MPQSKREAIAEIDKLSDELAKAHLQEFKFLDASKAVRVLRDILYRNECPPTEIEEVDDYVARASRARDAYKHAFPMSMLELMDDIGAFVNSHVPESTDDIETGGMTVAIFDLFVNLQKKLKS